MAPPLADWLLDTNAVSALMRQDSGVTGWLEAAAETDNLILCTVVHGEIWYGLSRFPPGARRRALERAYNVIAAQCGPLVGVTRGVGETYGRLKAQLESSGLVLPENDLWIAATALAHGLSLLSADRHFEAVPGLPVADWTLHSRRDASGA